MTTNFRNTRFDPRNNPLLRDVDRVSPATELTLVVDYDDEGWGVWKTFSVGMVAAIELGYGDLWQVVGFTLDNEVLVRPYGLGATTLVTLVCVKPSGFAGVVKSF